jgi:hypothetical protein
MDFVILWVSNTGADLITPSGGRRRTLFDGQTLFSGHYSQGSTQAQLRIDLG